MRKTILVFGVIGGLTAYGAMPATASSIPAKLKSSKVQGDLIPAFACEPSDTTADCSGSVQTSTCSGSGDGCGLFDPPCPSGETCSGGNVTKSALNGRGCTFEKGSFKFQTGKDTAVQVSGLKCTGATPSALCGHISGYFSIMSQNVDAKGNVTPINCPTLPTGNPAGTSNFAIAYFGSLTCDAKGNCKGVLPVTNNPCPGVDAVSQVTSVDVFDGPASVSFVNLNGSGLTLKGCCGTNQYLIPGANTGEQEACQNAGKQDVLATMGTVTQIP